MRYIYIYTIIQRIQCMLPPTGERDFAHQANMIEREQGRLYWIPWNRLVFVSHRWVMDLWQQKFYPPKKIEAFCCKKRPVFQGQSDTMFNAATLAVWNTGGWFPPFFWRESGGFERKHTMRTWDFRGWSGWWYTYDTSHLFTYESCVRWMFDDNSGDDRCLMDDSSCH